MKTKTKKLRLGVDASSMYQQNPRGIGKSLFNLYDELTKCAPDWDFYFYFDKENERFSPWKTKRSNIYSRPISMRGHRFNFWLNLRLPLALKMDKIDILHAPAQEVPFFKVVPTIVTIHDIIPLKFDDGWNEVRKVKFLRDTHRAISKSDHIITISHHTKKDLSELFANQIVCPIDVVHWGTSIPCNSVSEPVNKERKFHGPFFFAVGGDSPRKNIDNLIAGFEKFSIKNNKYRLVVSGLPKAVSEELSAKWSTLAEEQKLSLLGYISDGMLSSLMKKASAFVFPSLYEGFGLPVLEAMASQTLVIAARNSAIPEVAGNSVLYIEGEAPEDITIALRKYNKLSREECSRLVCESQLWIKNFTWENTAQKTFNIIDNLKPL